MSGGSIAEYSYFRINDVIDDIERVIAHNKVPDEFAWSYGYSDETLDAFRNGIEVMKAAIIYAHRIDWLVSGDDGEESFHSRLSEELEELYK